MNRYILRRLALIPLVLIAVNFFGFAYAYLVQPGQLARNPFLAVMAGPTPVLPVYVAYIKGLFHGDMGALPPAGAPIGPVVVEATIASLGLLSVALLLSVLVGLGMGVAAVRTPGQHGRFGMSEGAGIAPWLTITTTMGLAMPSFYIGSLLIMATLAYLIWGPKARYCRSKDSAGTCTWSAGAGVGCPGRGADRPDERRAAGGRAGQDLRGCRAQRGIALADDPSSACAPERRCSRCRRRFRRRARDGRGTDHRGMAFLLARPGTTAGLDAHPTCSRARLLVRYFSIRQRWLPC